MSQENNITKNKVISSLIWKFLERCGVQGVQFVLSLILARLVSPEDYGVVSIILIFIQIATVFVQSGFNTALIQKKDSDELDFSSVFYLSLFFSTICYVILFFASPYIASFFNQEILTSTIKIVSITLFFGAVNSVQNAFVSKTMQFKKFFFSNTGSVFFSGIIGVVLAYKNFGVWALVIQQLVKEFITCVILWFTVKWRPKLLFSLERAKSLFSFGWKLLCSSLLDTVFKNIYSLIIGRVFNSQQLGYFNRGQHFPMMIATNLDGSIQGVMLPTLSSHNDNIMEVKKITRRSISTSAYLLMPCMFGMAVIAEPLVRLLLSDKWIFCIPFLQLACIDYAFYPIHTANLTGINALGRSDIFLKLEIIKKIITVINIAITVKLGVMAMAIGQVVTCLISTFINAYPNKKLMHYSYFEQWKDLLPSFLTSLLMASIVWCEFFFLKEILMTGVLFAVQFFSGVLIYILLSKIFKLEVFSYFISSIKEFRSRK